MAKLQNAGATSESTKDLQVKTEKLEDKVTGLSNALSSLSVSRLPKLQKYSSSKQNFARFCERFTEHLQIADIKDDNLYILGLSDNTRSLVL